MAPHPRRATVGVEELAGRDWQWPDRCDVTNETLAPVRDRLAEGPQLLVVAFGVDDDLLDQLVDGIAHEP